MKFHADGPDIPDHLLWERDAGKVVFVCGAGVSRAKAKMPDFPTLASQVLDELLVPDESKARKVLELALRPENEGLVPIDKVFGELEKVYSVSDIDAAVSKVLMLPVSANTECHEIIRDLATTPHGAIRLVTTNFDDLFSRISDQPEWVSPNLPSFERTGPFTGLVYLHGKCGSSDRLTTDSFVLSTRSFGRAYMAEGWASNFLKDVLEHYTVIFVGYSADDPPMQYLLEALARSDMSQRNVYAFQQGDKLSADEKWNHRGVSPIAFGEYDDLWETLKLWRERAINLENWIKSRLKIAQVGPFQLTDWQRSQVTHLASHLVGAKAIAESEEPLPPQWLFCFDRTFRYATPNKRYIPDDQAEHPDPFLVLGLAEEPTPKQISSDDPYTNRPTLEDAWDAFLVTRQDIDETIDERSFASLRGTNSINPQELSPRLEKLAIWIGKVANFPIVVRWAAHQTGLHPSLKRSIQSGLKREAAVAVPFVEEAWEMLFEAWEQARDEDKHDQYHLKTKIDRSGWSNVRVRQYQRAFAPRTEVQSFRQGDAIFSNDANPNKLGDLIQFGLKFPEDRVELEVPDEWLEAVLRADRHNLDQAIKLKKQIDHYGFYGLPPILPSDDPDIFDYVRTHGVNALAFCYLSRFEKLIEIDHDKAVAEFRSWPLDDVNIFGRFRIWTAGEEGLLADKEAGEVLANLPQVVFWGSCHQRDFLNVLKFRWNSLPLAATRKIEKRIISGDDVWNGEEASKHAERKAWQSANMLQWLNDNGCKLNQNFDDAIANLQQATPSWTPGLASKADESHEAPSGSVRTITDYTVLADVSIDEIIDVASKSMGRRTCTLEESDPFVGICQDYPAKALSSLRRKANLGVYPEWAWSSWLKREGENAWSKRQLLLTSVLLSQASDDQLVEARYSVYRWFEKVSGNYTDRCFPIRDQLFRRLLYVLKTKPEANSSDLVRKPYDEIEWMNITINSPAGELAKSLFNYPEIKDLPEGTQLPSDWIDAVVGLLSLPGDNARFALVCFMKRLRWFHYLIPEWTETHILETAESDDPLTVDAYWAGLATGIGKLPTYGLFLKIKSGLITKFSAPLPMNKSQYKSLSSSIMAGWLNRREGERWISDSEFSAVLSSGSDELRNHILWQMRRRASEEVENPSFDWDQELEQFFVNVWPRTLAAKSSRASESMLEIAFTNADRLQKLASVISPRLGKLEHDSFMLLSDFHRENTEILKKHPEIVLELLYRSLPGDPSDWPCEMNKTLEVIEEISPELREDLRLKELKMRWANR